jgi:hypothetical protein
MAGNFFESNMIEVLLHTGKGNIWIAPLTSQGEFNDGGQAAAQKVIDFIQHRDHITARSIFLLPGFLNFL